MTKRRITKKKNDFVRPNYLTADEIIRFGWSMQLPIEITMEDLQNRGFLVSKQAIIETWTQLDELMESA